MSRRRPMARLDGMAAGVRAFPPVAGAPVFCDGVGWHRALAHIPTPPAEVFART